MNYANLIKVCERVSDDFYGLKNMSWLLIWHHGSIIAFFQWHRRKFPKLWCSNMLTIQLENFIFQLLEYGISKPSSRPQNTKWSGDKEILIPYWQNERSLIRLYAAKEDNILPSFVLWACNPSGGIKVMGHWPSPVGRILWGSCTDLPIPSKEMD